jgi:hypothetical protein
MAVGEREAFPAEGQEAGQPAIRVPHHETRRPDEERGGDHQGRGGDQVRARKRATSR